MASKYGVEFDEAFARMVRRFAPLVLRGVAPRVPGRVRYVMSKGFKRKLAKISAASRRINRGS